MGQNVADFQMGRTTAPFKFVDREIFFQAEMSFPIGGQIKRHSSFQETEKASVADDPGTAYFEKNLEQWAFDRDTK